MCDEEKPPIGLRPDWLWSEQVVLPLYQERLQEISRAIIRYTKAGKPVSGNWIKEMDQLNAKVCFIIGRRENAKKEENGNAVEGNKAKIHYCEDNYDREWREGNEPP